MKAWQACTSTPFISKLAEASERAGLPQLTGLRSLLNAYRT
jgi:hypothetical protein